ncbi:MAG TPA: hypothetical protein VKY29_02255, partial [Cryomorphaceae bacterium]|nr:hypothetical protein [Cryomorphaceae bacterium]
GPTTWRRSLRKPRLGKLTTSLLFFFVFSWFGAIAQVPGYEYLGEEVTKRSAVTGEVLGTGMLLDEVMFQNDEIKKLTLRYASDTTAYTKSGVLHVVERLLDFYYPDPDIVLESADGEVITNLPLMVVLHAGQGTKESTAGYARFWASQGYTVLVPTMRSDRLGVGYCIGYVKTVYSSVQDVRAAIRLYSKLYELSLMGPEVLQGHIPNREIGEAVDEFRVSRTDGNTIFMVGRSYGGTVAYHTSTRTAQTDFEDFLWADEPYVINGADGPIDLGNSDLLDDVGVPFARDQPFPTQSIRGFLSRTAGVFVSLDVVDYDEANRVPGFFIHNTCDNVVPYQSVLYDENQNDCKSQIELPDGSVLTEMELFGSNAISQYMSDNGVYSELITYCGGGHTSNTCWTDLNDFHSNKFVLRVLNGNYEDGVRNEKVYRYHLQNYSPQCCDLGDDYGYIQKCSCDDSNPYDVIVLPYKPPGECPFSPTCELTSLCDLEPPGMELEDGTYDAEDDAETQIELGASDGETILIIRSPQSGPGTLRILDIHGREIHVETVDLKKGINEYDLPPHLPRGRFFIARMDGVSIKFQLP